MYFTLPKRILLILLEVIKEWWGWNEMSERAEQRTLCSDTLCRNLHFCQHTGNFCYFAPVSAESEQSWERSVNIWLTRGSCEGVLFPPASATPGALIQNEMKNPSGEIQAAWCFRFLSLHLCKPQSRITAACTSSTGSGRRAGGIRHRTGSSKQQCKP